MPYEQQRKGEEVVSNPIFSILYETGSQQYVIGITYGRSPVLASMGVNTSRPLPNNVKNALIEMIRSLKHMQEDPKFIDYNLPSRRASATLLGNLSVTPVNIDQPARTPEEVLGILRKRIENEHG